MTPRVTATRLVLLVAAMFGFAFALVPLYDALCRATGLNGKLTERPVTAAAVPAPSRELTIQFVTNVQGDLPWSFRPLARRLTVRTGEYAQAEFEVANLSPRPTTGRALANLMPGPAAEYLHKVRCFCFDTQTLGPGERRTLHLGFTVSSELPVRYRSLTLAYTFVEPPGGS